MEKPLLDFPKPMETSAEAPLSPEVVKALVENHREFLAFLHKRLGDRSLAEDILQEAFVRGLHKLGTLEKDESATAWFYRILRNAVIDHHRRRASVDRKLEAFAQELEQYVEPDAEVRGAVCRCVGELAGTLKPEYAEALRRVELDGVAVKDYAAEAGITSNNAAVRVFRAREALRKQVSRSCGTCADHGCLDCTCDKSSGPCH
jgi:RNA polymerase sigma factor (sigma-70 family)